MLPVPSASFAFTIRCRIKNTPGRLATLISAVGAAGGDMRAIDIVRVDRDAIVRDLTVLASNAVHAQAIVEALHHLEDIEVLHYSDRTFLAHLGGKIAVVPKTPIHTRDDLSMVYTPGVARVSLAIAHNRELARNLTIRRNAVAIVTDGSAVLGLGNLGPEAALPVMEGKAMLFKEFGQVDAFPLCLATQDVEEIIATVRNIAPVFGGINLEDISGPRCFEIERRLEAELDIPVFHDDQHGTAVVVMAALLNALKVVGKRLDEVRVVALGIGAAGTACIRLMTAAGVRDIVAVDRDGILDPSRMDSASPQQPREGQPWCAANTNPRRLRGSLADALAGADVFIGTSAAGAVTMADVAQMADRPIIFALANPEPEIAPELVAGHAAVIATGRSDYPNQINNVLCFPGFFRGLLDSGAGYVTEGMKLAAARAIAAIVGDEAVDAEYIVPSVFNRQVAPAVAEAVSAEAHREGLARSAPELFDPLHG